MLIDDIAIPEIGYSADFEKDDGGWKAAGFARVQNVLPQDFRLTLLSRERRRPDDGRTGGPIAG